VSEPAELHIEGPLRRWGPDVALVTTRDGPLAMVFGPPVLDPAALAEAQLRARSFVDVEAPGLLPLRRVEHLKGRIGYGYDVPEGASLVALTRHRPVVPLAAAAGIVSRLAEIACELGPDAHQHPGPTKPDVIVERTGRVRLAGLAGPRTVDHADEPGLVERLGRLLAEMLLGRPLHPARHAPPTVVDQLAEHSGPRFDRTWQDLLLELLDPEPARRPTLPALVEAARSLAATPTGETVDRWVQRAWPAIDPPDPLGAFSWDPTAMDRPTQPSEEPLDDDPDEPTVSQHDVAPRLVREQGSIPVDVGPPPEAMRPVRLPADVFGLDDLLTDPGPRRGAARVAVWGAALGFLVAAALVAGLTVALSSG